MAPRLTLSLPTLFAVRGWPGALALQLVSSSSSRIGGPSSTTSRSRSYLPPCLVARAGRKHLPVGTLKSQARRNVTKVPTLGPRKSVRSTDPVGGMIGALVVNLTCEVRRVAKLPSEPRGRPIKSDRLNMWTVSHSNTRTSHSNTLTQDTLGQGVSALKNSCEKAL